jgi:hypothetical protein
MRTVIPLTILAVSTPATADTAQTLMMYADRNAPEVIGPVNVLINDQTSDACWTNLRDVREYVEEKLVAEGFQLAEAAADLFNLSVSVVASRQESLFGRGYCSGLITVELSTGYDRPGGPSGNLVTAQATVGIPRGDSLNEPVIWWVGVFFDGLSDRLE